MCFVTTIGKKKMVFRHIFDISNTCVMIYQTSFDYINSR
jgi:hypothetical protein